MKKFYLGFVLLLASSTLMAQSVDSSKVKWSFSAIKNSDASYTLKIAGRIEKGWRLFSSTMSDDLPNTRIMIDSSSASYASINSVKEEGKLVMIREPVLDNATVRYFEDEVNFFVNISLREKKDLKGNITFMVYRRNEFSNPETVPFRYGVNAGGALVSKAAGLQESLGAAEKLKRSAIVLASPVNSCGGTGAEDSKSKSLLGIFVLGFLGGLIGLLTPCVFPMIPLTVSFFTRKTESRKKGILNASLYGFFILFIYVALSIPFYFLDSSNPEILNNISTNTWLNLFFFVIFVVFALSFFGLFEINAPSSLANKADERAGVGGLGGIFFMALTLALVSFSCTGPILGSLLAGSLSTNGGAVQLTMGMAGFGLALALPFTVFALFPSLLKSLPRSGGWLTSVKIVLGFLELALAVKFLSNADLVQHWGLLKREVFFAIWIVIGLLLVLYLFGILKFKGEGPVKLSPVRLVLALFFLAFTVYLVPGVSKSRYANRSLISGFPPPLSYSIYGRDAFKGVEPKVVNDYEKALALAREQHKPLMIDFTGWACVNCRKMEENVWIDPEVKELIEKNFILVSLYVDDRKLLPEDQQFVYKFPDGSSKPLRTIGDQYATFQSVNFGSVSQPLYALVSPDEKLLTRPVGYTPNAQKYAEWLRCGLEALKK